MTRISPSPSGCLLNSKLAYYFQTQFKQKVTDRYTPLLIYRLPDLVLLIAGTTVSVTLLAFFPSNSLASFTEQLAIDTRAISLANNVTASPPGLMSIHYNPAGLSLLGDGNYFSMSATLPVIKKTSKFEADPEFKGFAGFEGQKDPLAGTEGTNSSGRMSLPFLGPQNFLVSPAIGLSHRAPGSDWTFAIGLYAPFAIGFIHAKENDPSRFGGQSVYQQHLIFAAPAVSYQVNKTLSIGASVGLGQTAMGASLDMRSPNDIVGMTKVLGDATKGMEIPLISELTFRSPFFGGGIGPYDRVASFAVNLRDDFSPSYNLGLLWEPTDWFSFGASYQSEIKTHMVGTYKLSYSNEWQRMADWFGSTPTLLIISGMLGLPNKAVPEQSGIMTADNTFPQIVNLGVKVNPFKKLSILSDVHWANWSVLNKDRFVFDQKIQLLQFVKVLGYTGGENVLQLNRNFKDTWNWGVGAEYQLLDWLTLRAGYENRKSSVQNSLFDLLYALPNLDSYGAGLGIKLKNGMEIDLAAAYLVNKSYKIKNNQSLNMNSTEFTNPVYNPYAGLNYEQRTETYMGSFKLTLPF